MLSTGPHPRLIPTCGRGAFETIPPTRPDGSHRRLVLVALDWHRPKDPRTPLGHASLAASVAMDGTVELAHAAFSVSSATFSVEGVAAAILAHTRGLPPERVDVGVGAYLWNEAHIRRLLPLLRLGGFEGRIILGGPQITFAGAGLETLYPDADVFIRGQAEAALPKVVASHDPVAMTGVLYAGQPDHEGQATVEGDALVSPYLTGILPLGGLQPFVRWETRRGCPVGTCAFCQHRSPGARPHSQALDWDRIEAEIALFSLAGVQDIAVLDPVFHGGARAIRILDTFRSHGWRGRLSVQCRFEMVRTDFLDACAGLNIRLEFGLQTIHPKEMAAIGRPNDLDKAGLVIDDLLRRGIPFEVSIIYGLPEQTPESFLATIDWCLRRRVPVVKAFPLELLRGTALDKDRDRWSLIENDDLIPLVVASSTFGKAEWMTMRRYAAALAATEGAHPPTGVDLAEVATQVSDVVLAVK